MPTIDMAATGQKINDMRKAANMTVKDLQDIFGCTPAAVYRWIAGTAIPAIDNLVIMADVFQVKIDDILVVKK